MQLTALTMNVAQILNSLQLHKLGAEWTNVVWESEFLELDSIPSDYEEVLEDVDVVKILSEASNCIKHYAKNVFPTSTDTAGEQNIFNWQSLVQEHDVQYRELLCILMYFMKNGHANLANETYLKISIKATCLYFLLLSVPGSNAYFVFHSSIYDKALESLTWAQMLTDTKKSRASHGSDDDVTEGNCDKLSERGKQYLLYGLNEVLYDLGIMTSIYPLRDEGCLRKTVLHLVELTRCDMNSTHFNFNRARTDPSLSSLSCNAYIILRNLCSTLHGKVEETLSILMMFLLPSVTMSGTFAKGIPFSNLSKICSHTVNFIHYLLVTLQEQSHESVFIFIQNLCSRIIDKADYRQKGAQNVVSIMHALPSNYYNKSIKWLMAFAHAKKVPQRLFAVEVISKLLYEEEPADQDEEQSQTRERSEKVVDENVVDNMENEATGQGHNDVMSHKYLLGILFSRCHDKASSVRSKALSTLSDCAKSTNASIRKLMNDIFVTPYIENDDILDEDVVERGFMDSVLFLKSLKNRNSQQMDPLPGGKAVILELLNLRKDDKVFVRKSALQLMENVMKLNEKWMTPKLLEVLCAHCRDPALIVKKQVIQALTDLLCLHPDNKDLPNFFVDAVLPQVSNAEMKVQEKVLEMLQKVMLDNIQSYPNTRTMMSKLPWTLARAVISTKKRKFFLKACSIWSKNGSLLKNLVPMLKTHINTENNIAAWLLLSCLSEFMEIKNAEFILEYYRNNYLDTSEEGKYAVMQSLNVLATSWNNFPANVQEEMCSELVDALRNSQLDVNLIGPALDVATLISRGKSQNVKEGHQAVSVWAEDLLKECADYVDQNSPLLPVVVEVSMGKFARSLVLLGDLLQLLPGKASIQTVETILSLLLPEEQCHPEMWTQPGLQALAVITLGKICLQHELLAKRIVPVLGNLLTKPLELAVKINTMNTLSDMCVRYTAMVEPLVPKMCMCLISPQSAIRFNTLVILIRLLQQDFLKLRGTLFFHLISMLRDTNPSVLELINYFLKECLVQTNKNIMYHNIAESIFYFNKYENHELYSHLTQEESGSSALHLFDLSGRSKKEERYKLYQFMCEHMEDDYRIKTRDKLSNDIFGGVVNGKILLNETGECVVRDTFFILGCEELRLQSLKKQSHEEDPLVDHAAEDINAAKKSLLSVLMKQKLMDIHVPMYIQLRTKLGSTNSRLLPEFRTFLCCQMKEYKDELLDIFQDARYMADEILLEFQKLEEEEEDRSRLGQPTNRTQHCGDENAFQSEDIAGPFTVTDELQDNVRSLQLAESQDKDVAGPSKTPDVRPCTIHLERTYFSGHIADKTAVTRNRKRTKRRDHHSRTSVSELSETSLSETEDQDQATCNSKKTASKRSSGERTVESRGNENTYANSGTPKKSGRIRSRRISNAWSSTSSIDSTKKKGKKKK